MGKKKKGGEYSFQHTRERLKQRYGITAGKKEYDQLCEMTRKKAESCGPVKIEKNGRDSQMILSFMFMGKRMSVVWSCKDRRVRTVLPPSY